MIYKVQFINLLSVSIFRKIKETLEKRKVLNDSIEEFKNLDEVLLEKRIQIFSEIVTPKFTEIGLKNWNGKYIWYSDFNNEGIKKVIEYNVSKGFGGSFTFGNCFSFVPTISSKKLLNHKTEKSTKIIYFKRLDGSQKSLENNTRCNPDRISTVNEEKFRLSLNTMLANNLSKLQKWFGDNDTIEKNIVNLTYDINNPPYEIGQRTISNEYVLAFLLAQKIRI